ncbi:hypothetical protein GM658_28515 [Pseudoduganella eburnea]|uniref:Adhesin n=1 Tax=Massilia eburnea TaxID=1776165 RepID=A0A6L6QR32_9BURK|nr:hemagglutinin repeat-containing protein [Massilia eburnea]MTW14564.1 hypothetical protein [Massilia eburnea]
MFWGLFKCPGLKHVTAGNDVNITAKSIDITALDNTVSSQTADSNLKFDAFARVSSPLIDLVNNVNVASKSDGRVNAMQGIAAAGKNHSAGTEVGVGFQVGAQTGVYVYAAANVGNGHNNSDSTINNNTQLKADTINLHCKGDTTLRGATATADTINADVGGKLAVESVQDTSKEETSQTGVGVRVQVGFGVWSASGNVSQANSHGSSTSVGQQSGLFAGDGGYHVKADTVDLKGGAIVSSNTTDSELTTNALTTSNLENKMSYSASYVSMAGGIGGGSDFGKKDDQGKTIPYTSNSNAFGSAKDGNATPGLPMYQRVATAPPPTLLSPTARSPLAA